MFHLQVRAPCPVCRLLPGTEDTKFFWGPVCLFVCLIFILCWSIVDLQCHISFRNIAK